MSYLFQSKPRDGSRSKLHEVQSLLTDPTTNLAFDAHDFAEEVAKSIFYRNRLAQSQGWNQSAGRIVVTSYVGWRSNPRAPIYVEALCNDASTVSQRRVRVDLFLPRATGACKKAVLHGMTLALTGEEEPFHGRMFARQYLQMVKRFMGPDAYEELKLLYRQYNVKRQPYSEQRAARARDAWLERQSAEAVADLRKMIGES